MSAHNDKNRPHAHVIWGMHGGYAALSAQNTPRREPVESSSQGADAAGRSPYVGWTTLKFRLPTTDI